MTARVTHRLTDHQSAFIRLIQANCGRYRSAEVFRDFCELSALSVSNAVDRAQVEAREARYLKIVSRYERAEVERFPQLLGELVLALENGFDDCLGRIFMALEFGDAWRGQFFTPYEISSMMARMTMYDAGALIEQQGFITLCEPAVGAGGMVVACAEVLRDLGINYQQALHVTAIDVDETAAHMAYIQFTLLHIPAIVIHGNALSGETWSHWVTPAHVLGRWDYRLRRRKQAQALADAASAESAAAPSPVETIAVFRDDLINARLDKANQLSLF